MEDMSLLSDEQLVAAATTIIDEIHATDPDGVNDETFCMFAVQGMGLEGNGIPDDLAAKYGYLFSDELDGEKRMPSRVREAFLKAGTARWGDEFLTNLLTVSILLKAVEVGLIEVE